jgi:hypothetical protein
MKTGPKRTPIQIKQDRVTIAELYIKGVYQSVIAKQLGLSQVQISYDLKAIQKQWIKETTLSLDQYKGKELARLDEVERTAWDGYSRSKQEFKSKIIKGKELEKNKEGQTKGKSIEQTIKTEERVGNPKFLDVIVKCIELRCKLLGLNEEDDKGKALKIIIESSEKVKIDQI